MFFSEKGELKDEFDPSGIFDTDLGEIECEAINPRY